MARNVSVMVKHMNLEVKFGNGFVLRVFELFFAFPVNVQLLEHFRFLFLAVFWRLFG